MDQNSTNSSLIKRELYLSDSTAHSFLWEKWKHHDELLYTFINAFWAVQAVSFAILPFIAVKKYIYGILFLLLLSYINIFYFRKSLKIARIIRNTFNPQITQILIDKQLLPNNFSSFMSTWKAEDDSHPINLWHTPYPFKMGINTRNSSKFENLIELITALEIISSIVWLALELRITFN